MDVPRDNLGDPDVAQRRGRRLDCNGCSTPKIARSSHTFRGHHRDDEPGSLKVIGSGEGLP